MQFLLLVQDENYFLKFSSISSLKVPPDTLFRRKNEFLKKVRILIILRILASENARLTP